MRKTIMILFLIAFLTGVIGAAQRESTSVQQTIRSKYDQFNQAWKSKDRQRVEEVFSPDCKFKQADEAQVLTLPRYMKGIEFSFRAMSVASAETLIDSIKLTADTAEVVARINTETRLTISDPAANPSARKTHKSTQIVHDTWRKTSGGWRIVMRVIEG